MTPDVEAGLSETKRLAAEEVRAELELLENGGGAGARARVTPATRERARGILARAAKRTLDALAKLQAGVA